MKCDTVIKREWKLQDQVRFSGSTSYLLERLVRQTRDVCTSLRKKGYLKDDKKPLKTRGLREHNKVTVREQFGFILNATGVVIGLRASSMHLSGHIANQCYVQPMKAIASGIYYDYDVLWMGKQPKDNAPGEFNDVCMIFTVGARELRKAVGVERLSPSGFSDER